MKVEEMKYIQAIKILGEEYMEKFGKDKTEEQRAAYLTYIVVLLGSSLKVSTESCRDVSLKVIGLNLEDLN